MKAGTLLIAAALAGGAGAALWSLAEPQPSAAQVSARQPAPGGDAAGVPIRQAGETFACTPTRVWDGDGPIWCAEGPRIRLAGIAAREVKRTNGRIVDAGCKDGHPCSTIDGLAARDHLVELVGRATGEAATGHVLVRGEVLTCESVGSGKGVRTAAWCRNGSSGDLSRAMVRDGFAERWERYWRD